MTSLSHWPKNIRESLKKWHIPYEQQESITAHISQSKARTQEIVLPTEYKEEVIDNFQKLLWDFKQELENSIIYTPEQENILQELYVLLLSANWDKENALDYIDLLFESIESTIWNIYHKIKDDSHLEEDIDEIFQKLNIIEQACVSFIILLDWGKIHQRYQNNIFTTFTEFKASFEKYKEHISNK